MRRKIEQLLLQWKQNPNRKPLVVKGCRQCGKTYSVLSFAHANYEHVIYLNFHEQPSYKKFFQGALDVQTITMLISAAFPSIPIVSGKTCFVLDEIQECPRARTIPITSVAEQWESKPKTLNCRRFAPFSKLRHSRRLSPLKLLKLLKLFPLKICMSANFVVPLPAKLLITNY